MFPLYIYIIESVVLRVCIYTNYIHIQTPAVFEHDDEPVVSHSGVGHCLIDIFPGLWGFPGMGHFQPTRTSAVTVDNWCSSKGVKTSTHQRTTHTQHTHTMRSPVSWNCAQRVNKRLIFVHILRAECGDKRTELLNALSRAIMEIEMKLSSSSSFFFCKGEWEWKMEAWLDVQRGWVT